MDVPKGPKGPPPFELPSMPYESEETTVIGVSIAFGILTAIAITLRVWARSWLVKSFGADDALICIAAILSWALMIDIIFAVHHGLGQHFPEVMKLGRGNGEAYSFTIWLAFILYNAALGFIKTSVLALYMRLGDETLRLLAIGMMVVVTCQSGANIIALIFQCVPVEAAWDLDYRPDEKRCINIATFYLVTAGINIVTDILTYTLPIRLILRLQMPLRQKIALIVVLGLGLFACISSGIRIAFIPRLLYSYDVTWVLTGAMTWSVVEVNIGILATSIPTYTSIAKRYAPHLLRGSINTSGTTQPNKQRVGFQIMHRGLGAADLDLRDLDPGRKSHRFGFDTTIEHGLTENGSEEALYPPGQIGVRTSIVTYSQGA
ncbi:integral membrane protein [Xylariomycetidae sp. FL2044]|nr:integral membrane protein [Xylariomycetidae sp. FL2044]